MTPLILSAVGGAPRFGRIGPSDWSTDAAVSAFDVSVSAAVLAGSVVAASWEYALYLGATTISATNTVAMREDLLISDLTKTWGLGIVSSRRYLRSLRFRSILGQFMGLAALTHPHDRWQHVDDYENDGRDYQEREKTDNVNLLARRSISLISSAALASSANGQITNISPATAATSRDALQFGRAIVDM